MTEQAHRSVDSGPPGFTSEEVKANLAAVRSEIQSAAAASGHTQQVSLVAVSKTKPPQALRWAYEANQRVFGENYVQELIEKAADLPQDIEWHFIGHLQSNKAAVLVQSVPNLVVETVDSAKLAAKLDAAAARRGGVALPVYLQVNTSGEDSKSGVEPKLASGLATYIVQECRNLQLAGLMTIGRPDHTSQPADFESLRTIREEVAASIKVVPSTLGLSMGMSGDFIAAVHMGSTSVRVGSRIFGSRDPR